jgi:3-carboxy-cis,cis-muconate cycloisomerase
VRPFAAIFVPQELTDALSDRAWLEAMLDAERALANAGALAGNVPAAAAAAIAEQCEAERFDVDELAGHGRAAGNPVEPLVRALRERVGEEHGPYVHRGATSQDVLDSAAVLVARSACAIVDGDLAKVADLSAALAEDHRGTVMAARTLMQQAVPTTFGYKAAGWLVAIVEARERLARAADALPAQLGGAAGTLAASGDTGVELLRLYAAELELPEPPLPWHTRRTPFVDLAGALASVAIALGKIASDVVLLAQTEVGEVAEAADGASSTMPHKRNPVAAVLANACVRHVVANVGLLYESAVHEHERAAGAWHAEWHALQTALAATGGAAAAVARSLDGLQVDRERMRANIVAETLSEAQRVGDDAARPEDYLGSAEAFIDRALALHRR